MKTTETSLMTKEQYRAFNKAVNKYFKHHKNTIILDKKDMKKIDEFISNLEKTEMELNIVNSKVKDMLNRIMATVDAEGEGTPENEYRPNGSFLLIEHRLANIDFVVKDIALDIERLEKYI